VKHQTANNFNPPTLSCSFYVPRIHSP